jgi:hypothetical protein
MKIEGFTDDQIVALIEMWHLGNPIRVMAFLDRSDIPADVKTRVKDSGRLEGASREVEAAGYRRMQAQVILEVAKLDRERWQPLGAPRRGAFP